MRFRFLLLSSFVLFALFVHSPAQSQYTGSKKDPMRNVNDHMKVFMPKLEAGSIFIDDDNIPPQEPNLLKVKFLKIPPPRSTEGRIERLIHGILVDTPPESDHYGYEIRRYMAKIGNTRIFEDEEYLIEQIRNVRKARVIVEYWQAHIQKEVVELETLVDDMIDAPSIIKTNLRKNKAEARSFMADAQRWIDSNERYLQRVFDLHEYLDLYYPEIVFLRPHERIEFYNLLNTKQSTLARIKEYEPFSYMVY